MIILLNLLNAIAVIIAYYFSVNAYAILIGQSMFTLFNTSVIIFAINKTNKNYSSYVESRLSMIETKLKVIK